MILANKWFTFFEERTKKANISRYSHEISMCKGFDQREMLGTKQATATTIIHVVAVAIYTNNGLSYSVKSV